MLVPTKFTTLEESTIFKLRIILEEKLDGESILDLFTRTSGKFQDASEFLHAVDILYVLGVIDVDASTGAVKYAA
ncbi:ABC-three component system middle component 7 [Metapseudomonas otitidis]|uniref:ABC-three component system middle component 7 n=1 Tax=Metapseudomonas otitidis TaxID=319939 RepID=UPI00283AAA96|nr:ABC-three component system middle component 7 [Pseudomonas otitidis]